MLLLVACRISPHGGWEMDLFGFSIVQRLSNSGISSMITSVKSTHEIVPFKHCVDYTEDRSCHQVEWSENILCGGRHLN